MASYTNERSMGDIMQDVVRDFGDIVRAEIRLAKAEVGENAKKAGSAAGMFGGAAVCGLLGGMALVATCIAALALFMPVWLGALIMTVVLLCGGGAMYFAGRSKLRNVNAVPERTAQTIKDDIEWAKHHVK
jgi:hypothetical protein